MGTIAEYIARLDAAVASKRNPTSLLKKISDMSSLPFSETQMISAIPALETLLEQGKCTIIVSDLIFKIARTEPGQEAVARAGLLPWLSRLVASGDEQNQVAALQVLGVLGSSENALVVETLNKHHADEALESILRAAPSDANQAQEKALHLLWSSASNMSNFRLSRLRNAGCLDLLLGWLSHGTKAIPLHAAMAISKLAVASSLDRVQQEANQGAAVVALTEQLRVRARPRGLGSKVPCLAASALQALTPRLHILASLCVGSPFVDGQRGSFGTRYGTVQRLRDEDARSRSDAGGGSECGPRRRGASHLVDCSASAHSGAGHKHEYAGCHSAVHRGRRPSSPRDADTPTRAAVLQAEASNGRAGEVARIA